jgi:hypothetical protein
MRPRAFTRILLMILPALGFAREPAVSDIAYFAPSGTMKASVESMETGRPRRSTWAPEELERIARANDLHVAPYRENHVTLGTPAWIWSVAVDGELYVRAYDGARSSWYKSAIRERAGQISSAGMKRLVAFESVQGDINEKIDAAYRAKYAGSRYLDTMLGARAIATTVRIRPAD